MTYSKEIQEYAREQGWLLTYSVRSGPSCCWPLKKRTSVEFLLARPMPWLGI